MTKTLRHLGALCVLAVGAIHLQQYAGAGYSAIPTIGVLFLLNSIACGVVGIGLLAPLGRPGAGRVKDTAAALFALAGAAIAVTSLVMLFISESTTLFGFSEAGYRAAVVAAIAAEAAATVLLVPVAVSHLRRLPRGARATSGRGALRRPGAPGRSGAQRT
ncbi:MAG TPA: hypothetical protein VFT42_04620 [Solirubrobacteraceae bacterium]|nr:hypothetical protein [Solirubrobacteraceae bacterium]